MTRVYSGTVLQQLKNDWVSRQIIHDIRVDFTTVIIDVNETTSVMPLCHSAKRCSPSHTVVLTFAFAAINSVHTHLLRLAELTVTSKFIRLVSLRIVVCKHLSCFLFVATSASIGRSSRSDQV